MGWIDASAYWPPTDKAYFFRHGHYVRYRMGGSEGAEATVGLDAGYWTGLPFTSDLDAAATAGSRNVVHFFKGDQVVEYRIDPEGTTSSGRIGDLFPGLPPSFTRDLDAALHWPPNGKLYLFKGSEYVRYDLDGRAPEDDPLPIAPNWPGLELDRIDAVLVGKRDKAYFFRDDQYVTYAVQREGDRALHAPRPWIDRWPGLHAALAAITPATAGGATSPATTPGSALGPLGHVTTGFRPSTHGFRFANSFALPAAIRAAAGSIVPGARGGSYGLCGGMVALALDHFHPGTAIPTTTTVPTDTDPLHLALVDRQLDSLELTLSPGAAGFGAPVHRFQDWMGRPDRGPGSVAELTAPELVDVLSDVRRRWPPPVGLVLEDASGSLFDNHQVLVFDAWVRSATRVDLGIYDPNEPSNDDVVLACEVVGTEVVTTVVVGGAVSAVRGFFRMPYRPEPPPP